MFIFKLIVNLLTILNLIKIVFTAGGQVEFETKFGKIFGESIEGYKGRKLTVLRGVPFAKPPTADLRFKKPQQLDKFPANPFDATKNALICTQMMSKKRVASEMKGKKDDSAKDDDILSGNVDAKGGIIPVFRDTTEMDDSEDCLYMNIFVPQTATKNKGIVIYFHGGMFNLGKYDSAHFFTF